MADLRQATYCRDESDQADSLAKTPGIDPRNACVLSGRDSMLLASVPFGTRPYRGKRLRSDIVVREDRDAVEAIYRKRSPVTGNRVNNLGSMLSTYPADRSTNPGLSERASGHRCYRIPFPGRPRAGQYLCPIQQLV